MNQKEKDELKTLFEDHFKEKVEYIHILPPSGSYREYCRMGNQHRTIIGAVNNDVKENTAFLSFSSHFKKVGIAVPEIYAVSADLKKYILEDLGDTTLYQYLTETREKEGFSGNLVNLYKKVLTELPRIQILGNNGLDYSVCYPRAAFDRQSMMWDLSYFKYYFLKLAKIEFDEQILENDFQSFIEFLLNADSDYFLYRDFQSRNVMIKDEEVYFIDYQGGRKGALQYDLASLLYDGKANIPNEIRKLLLEHYLDELSNYVKVNREEFIAFYNGFVLIRIMQAMGAYGFRGFYEKKEHFLKSIPYALKNLSYLLKNMDLPIKIPELTRVLQSLTESEILREIGQSSDKNQLTVLVTSFSYKKGLPKDPSGNGGGFVFDCRAINNPGRIVEYKTLTGRDSEVQKFLEEHSAMDLFLESVKTLVNQSVNNYIERKFEHLCISFGCTGGQHRSVYAADKIAEYLQNNYSVNVVINHREQNF